MENQINPALESWFNGMKSDPDPVKRLGLINQQIDDHLNFQMVAWLLHEIGKKKGWVDKANHKEVIKPSYKDASGNQVNTDFELVTEYDLTKWKV